MKRDIWIMIQLGVLFLVFGVISLLIYFTSGRNRRLLIQKLRIGAIIVSLTAVIMGGCTSINPPPKCYVPVITEDPTIILDSNPWKITEKLTVSSDRIINGEIPHSMKKKYSYRILNFRELIVQEGEIKGSNTQVASLSIPFQIKLDENLKPGLYFIYFYDCDLEKIGSENYIRSYVFEIEEK
ncbi:hypothetical protein KAU33_00655 [Candidatus Dependentiae bacterium]|nr:hypothetical protein [Candidatus Dependentiae bacterium]